MRLWRKIGLTALAVALAAGATIWWLPARWALPWLTRATPELRLQQVSGTLWHGRAGRVLAADGEVLGQAQWRLSRLALIGRSQLWLAVAGPRLDVRGETRRLPGDVVEWRDVAARVDLALLAPPKWPGLPLRAHGEVLLHADRVLLQGSWPLDGRATLSWRDAALQTRAGTVAFGRLDAQLDARSGVVRAQWHDAGDGPLRTAGTLDASALGWRLEAALQPRGDAPLLRRWLAQFGTPDVTGTFHLERHGGLAAASRMENPAP